MFLWNLEICFSPRDSVWGFEGGVLLSFLLGLTVRSFWSDMEKCPTSATGQIFGATFWPEDLSVLCSKNGAKKDGVVKALFCGSFSGDSA